VIFDSSNCRLRSTPDRYTVMMPLLGDDPPEWKAAFNRLVTERSIDAQVVNDVQPWTIVVRFPAELDEPMMREALDAVKAIMGEANHQQSRALNTYPAEQWLMGWLKGRPPMTYAISNK
jgi:hypothetical protein